MDGLVLRKTRKFSGEMDCCSNKKMEDCMESCGSGKSGTGKKMKNSRTLASDALPLPVGLTNKVFFILFFTASYFLMRRWREKIRTSTPLHVLSLGELVAIVAQLASFIYLLGFFGIDYVQNFITGGNDDDDVREDEKMNPVPKDVVKPSAPEVQLKGISLRDNKDDDIAAAVCNGTVASYSLESTLGDCTRSTRVRRRALEMMTGRSLDGLPLEGFDYGSILGQCCELPVGYVQIPVGVALLIVYRSIMARSSSALLLTLLCVAALMCLSAARKERLLGRGGYNGPGASVTDILASKEFQVAAGKAWKESFLGKRGYDLYQERGGWVYADSNKSEINLVVQLASSQRSAQATQSTVIPEVANPRPLDKASLVANGRPWEKSSLMANGRTWEKSSLMANGRTWGKSSLATAQSTEIQLDNPEKDGVPTAEGRNYKLVADFHTLPFPGQERPDSDDVRKAYERGVPAVVVSCSGVFYYGPRSRASLDGPAGYPQTSSEQYKGQKEVRFGDNTVDSEGRCKP